VVHRGLGEPEQDPLLATNPPQVLDQLPLDLLVRSGVDLQDQREQLVDLGVGNLGLPGPAQRRQQRQSHRLGCGRQIRRVRPGRPRPPRLHQPLRAVREQPRREPKRLDRLELVDLPQESVQAHLPRVRLQLRQQAAAPWPVSANERLQPPRAVIRQAGHGQVAELPLEPHTRGPRDPVGAAGRLQPLSPAAQQRLEQLLLAQLDRAHLDGQPVSQFVLVAPAELTEPERVADLNPVRSYPQPQTSPKQGPVPARIHGPDPIPGPSDRKGTPVDTLTADDTWDRLGSITQLHRAATQVWEQAAPDSALQSLGLGVYLVQAQASALLPAGYPLPDPNPEDLEEQSALQLLAAAEELTRPLPVHRPDLVYSSQLVIDLCDLIREARDLGCWGPARLRRHRRRALRHRTDTAHLPGHPHRRRAALRRRPHGAPPADGRCRRRRRPTPARLARPRRGRGRPVEQPARASHRRRRARPRQTHHPTELGRRRDRKEPAQHQLATREPARSPHDPDDQDPRPRQRPGAPLRRGHPDPAHRELP